MATLHAHTLSNRADSVEQCPSRRGLFACGSYELDEATQQRHGQVCLFSLAAASEGEGEGEAGMAQVASVDTPGVLDLKWCASSETFGDGDVLLGAALANGSASVFAVKTGASDLIPVGNIRTEEDESALCLCLSLDWNTRVQPAASPLMALSQSNSMLSVVRLHEGGLTLDMQWRAHDLWGADTEVWITAFDAHHPNLLFSGADDSHFKCWDIRDMYGSPRQCLDGIVPDRLFTNKQHGGGVCSIQSHPHREHCIATGSYDGSLRLWDTRNMSRPSCLTTTPLGGGVWRVKWHPDASRANTLVAACMRGGVHVVEVDMVGLEAKEDGSGDGDGGIETLPTGAASILQYTEHGTENLAYGVDWLQCAHTSADTDAGADADDAVAEAAASSTLAAAAASAAVPSVCEAGMSVDQDDKYLLGSCSFYNCDLRVWDPALPRPVM